MEERVALITGAGSGIGKATAVRFARDGVRIIALDLVEADARETAAEIERAGGEALPVVADVSQEGPLRGAINCGGETFGRIDIVFANAGINGVWAPLDELTCEEWDHVMAVNLRGTFLTVKHSLPWLKKNGGNIVINSSVNGTRIFSNVGASAYACTKGAQVVFTKMIALELAQFCIRVNAVCPGAIETAIDEKTEKRDLEKVRIPVQYLKGPIPLTGNKSGSPEMVADVVAFLTSSAANHVTGSVIFVDGGQSLLQG